DGWRGILVFVFSVLQTQKYQGNRIKTFRNDERIFHWETENYCLVMAQYCLVTAHYCPVMAHYCLVMAHYCLVMVHYCLVIRAIKP
ncbi:MAG: hypothetical protein LBJ47_09325, partial [Tannerella sp.]|nr:hypothetical protein [Tannerella sp.]